jgi:S1-C subfamily serine protease
MACELGVPIRNGDVIIHLEGHQTPDLKTYRALMHPGTGDPVACAGDPIRVGVSRDEETLELRFPLPASRWISPLFRPEDESRRSSGFACALETDVRLTPNSCGGPVIDGAGRVAGIVIACRADGSSCVIPAAVAGKVVAD